jgi:NADPH:quinone reductase-like Zn-dependent oxidoreductase
VRAIAQDSYGPPDVRELREIDTPVAGDDEVLVRVHAAGLDQGYGRRCSRCCAITV